MTTTPSSQSPVAASPKEQAARVSRTLLDRTISGVGSMAADRITVFADDLRRIGRTLADSDTTGASAGLADQAASAADGITRYLRSADSQRLFSDADELARRNPAVAASTAFLLGLSVARFLKTSSSFRPRDPQTGVDER